MKTVFIVDDDFDILRALSRWLTKKGFTVRTFSHSAPLFDALQELQPDVIVLDINLKEEDGRNVCKEIKTKYGNDLPVILFSALFHTSKELKDGCADAFLPKPSSFQDITKLLNSYINIENR